MGGNVAKTARELEIGKGTVRLAHGVHWSRGKAPGRHRSGRARAWDIPLPYPYGDLGDRAFDVFSPPVASGEIK